MEFAEFINTPKVDNVMLFQPFKNPQQGTLCITGHHLIFSTRRLDNTEELWLLHSNVDMVEKKSSPASLKFVMILKCKNYTMLQIDFQNAEDLNSVAMSIENLSNIDDVTLKYPFFYRAMFEPLEDGWQAFLPENEYTRFKECSEDWRLSYVNKDYSVCPSYPHAVIVPKSIDDDTVAKAAAFRQYGRFPVLSYYHRQTKAVVMRSSQPLTGTNNKRCKEDEKLLNAVLSIGKRGFIVDTRSSNAAKAAQSKGGGYEPEMHYSHWKRIHQPVERRQAFNDSLIRLMEACCDYGISMDKWLSKLESSNWLTHIKDILTCACTVAQVIDSEGANILVHGSEGYDTTLQITSLVQLVLDHDCRTINGFEALIEREWLQAGHPFNDRCSKSAYAVSKSRNEAPVFLLFLDCVWQIWQQFPCSFEFNEEFLILIFEHAYSSQFGTFLCNSEKERKEYGLSKKTVSLWTYLARPEILEKYLNPMYDPNPRVIWPSVAPQSLTIWNAVYLRAMLKQAKQKEAWEEIKKIQDHDKELRSKVARLRRQLALLEREAVGAGVMMPAGLEDEIIPE
ncbi:hypothetical protein FSP39_012815 [Pinctada imbricata]|uniref:Myotubularin phosphatase domain-containing protein n=1 Tax=Pinctada imbricata TaxID=66713 RepID=A0AA89BMA4_PINIB|nr:hypothetical protein FSP39_012815 [Pinctada imbricata]